MLWETHQTLRNAATFIPALAVIAAIFAAVITDSWGDWTTGIVIGLSWFAVWLPMQTYNPSVRVRLALALAALALFVGGIAVFVAYALL